MNNFKKTKISVTQKVSATTSCNTAYPFAFENAHLPFLLSRVKIVLGQGIGIQVTDFQTRKEFLKILKGHPKFTVNVERETELFLLMIGNESPFW